MDPCVFLHTHHHSVCSHPRYHTRSDSLQTLAFHMYSFLVLCFCYCNHVTWIVITPARISLPSLRVKELNSKIWFHSQGSPPAEALSLLFHIWGNVAWEGDDALSQGHRAEDWAPLHVVLKLWHDRLFTGLCPVQSVERRKPMLVHHDWLCLLGCLCLSPSYQQVQQVITDWFWGIPLSIATKNTLSILFCLLSVYLFKNRVTEKEREGGRER